MCSTTVLACTKAVTECCILRAGLKNFQGVAIRVICFISDCLINNQHKFNTFFVRLFDFMMANGRHQGIFILLPKSYHSADDENTFDFLAGKKDGEKINNFIN